MWQARRVRDDDRVADPVADPVADQMAELVVELAKKTGVCWVRPEGATRSHAVWHTWAEDSLCLVSGGDEQRLPGEGLGDGDRAEVVMRSGDTGGRLVTWIGTVAVITPDDELWESVTSSLVAARLNLRDPSTAADHWAQHCLVRRIVPTGEYVETPSSLDDGPHRETPPDSPATTRARR